MSPFWPDEKSNQDPLWSLTKKDGVRSCLKGESPFISRPARFKLTLRATTWLTGSRVRISSSRDGGKRMRNASIAVLREIGVETGGSNVQFGINAQTGRVVVIEMNPRVSRSSALASKATGFPIAKVAAKLAVGYTLDELANDITGGAMLRRQNCSSVNCQ